MVIVPIRTITPLNRQRLSKYRYLTECDGDYARVTTLTNGGDWAVAGPLRCPIAPKSAQIGPNSIRRERTRKPL